MEFPKGHLDLFLVEIGEPRDNMLKVVVLEGKLGPSEMTDLGEARPLTPTERSRAWEIAWPLYVAYAVRNESYARLEDGEKLSKDRFYVRAKSAFLTYVSESTFATDDFPGPLVHWCLDTQNHCLDVVGAEPPEIRALEAASVARGPSNRIFVRG